MEHEREAGPAQDEPVRVVDLEVLRVKPPALIVLRPRSPLSKHRLQELKEQIYRLALPDGIKVIIVDDCDVMAVGVDPA